MNLEEEVEALRKHWGVVQPKPSVWREVKAIVRQNPFAPVTRSFVVNVSDGRCAKALARIKAGKEGYVVMRIVEVKEV